jgi:hypothetical protein
MSWTRWWWNAVFVLALGYGCSASGRNGSGGSESAGPGAGAGGGGATCGTCFGLEFTPCINGADPGPVEICPVECAPGLGCTDCVPGNGVCVGNEVHECSDDGTVGALIEVCDASLNLVCAGGACSDACVVAEDQPSNVG